MNEPDKTSSYQSADVTLEPTLLSSGQSAEQHSRPLRIRYIGDYELLEEIARGGMGVVFKARQVSLSRIVAVKMILSGQFANAENVKRFYVEAEAAAQLDHPGIVPIYEVGQHEGQHFFSMGFVDGGSLAKRVAMGPLPPLEAVELVRNVAEAVHYAHGKGVIHRDLKPGNILLDNAGRPRVTDFGLAKLTEGDSDLTGSGQILGTPSYMPPEQAAGRVDLVGRLSDVYSLGAIFYCLLTGRPPFLAATPLETLLQVQRQDPISPRKLNPAIPRDIDTIVLKCLDKFPSRRYESAQAIADELQRYLEGRPIIARPVGRIERFWRWGRRNPAVAGLTAAVAVCLIAGACVALWIRASMQEQRQQDSVAALVQRLASSDTASVPLILKDITRFRHYADPLLREEFAVAREETAKLRLSLALLPVDASQVDYVFSRLLESQPSEVQLIRDALAAYQGTLLDKLWAIVETPPTGQESKRLRAAAALAQYDPDSAKWKHVQEAVVNDLVNVPAVYLSFWVDSLRPVRTHLIPQLSAVFEDGGRREIERSLATDILADYAADNPTKLTNLLMDADERQFAVIFPKLKNYREQGLPLLTGEIEIQLPSDLPSSDRNREILAKRQANAAVALLRLNEPQVVWPLLKHSPDPRVRSYLIHRLSPLGVDPAVIIKRLNEEQDVPTRRALLLSLGEYRESDIPLQDLDTLLPQLQTVFCTHVDAGLHSASEWLLRKWGHEAWLVQVNEEWSNDRAGQAVRERDIRQTLAIDKGRPPQWYVTGQGQTMVVIPGPVDFVMGSPDTEAGREPHEAQRQIRIGRTFCISAKAVTFEEYHKQNDQYKDLLPAEYRRVPNLPAIGVSWYLAAKYCNWLSEQEGIPPEQHCYQFRGDQLQLEAEYLKPNYLSLSGYRLPTEAEIEYATRAGARTSRYFGETEDLLPKYAWYQKNANEKTWPVGTLKPNDLGFFDMHGNTWVWCQETTHLNHQGPGIQVDNEDSLLVSVGVSRRIRSGSFFSKTSFVRSAVRSAQLPSNRNDHTGFRVARTLSLVPISSLPPTTVEIENNKK